MHACTACYYYWREQPDGRAYQSRYEDLTKGLETMTKTAHLFRTDQDQNFTFISNSGVYLILRHYLSPWGTKAAVS